MDAGRLEEGKEQVELSLDSGVFHCLVFLSCVDNIPHQWLNTEPEIMN